jgi:hypothetical protein
LLLAAALTPGSPACTGPVREVELLTGFETFTGTNELLIETAENPIIPGNEYAGGEGSYESLGIIVMGLMGTKKMMKLKAVAIITVLKITGMIHGLEEGGM